MQLFGDGQGGASLDQSAKVPTCGRGEVLIRVKAAAINPVDYKLGRMLGSVVGLDVAGVVESVGNNVTSLKVGDEVFGGVSGSLAEFAVGKPESLGKKAKCLSFVEAAAMPIAYMTSLQSLRDAGNLKPGSQVLIIGASGGLCFTLGIAKSLIIDLFLFLKTLFIRAVLILAFPDAPPIQTDAY